MSFLSKKNINLKVVDKSRDNEYFYCSFCDYPNIKYDDFISSEKYECCHDCYLAFIEARKDKWKKGQRPNHDMLDSYITLKKKINSLGG